MKQYETVIGLEVHVELATKTKIFCGCSTEFGGEPNTHTCPVCTGMPGSLPVLNRKVVEFALKAGMAAHLSLIHILQNPYANSGQKVTFDPKAVYHFGLEKTLDEKVLLKKCADAITKGRKTELTVDVTNTDRTFGTPVCYTHLCV